MIETYLLEYFLAFSQEGSLLKASKKLHVSQPSLTRAMRKLESELNLTIFERGSNKIALNENGKILVDYARDVLALNELMEQKAKELKDKESFVRIAMTAPGIMFFYPRFFFDKRNQYTSKISDMQTCVKETLEGLLDLAFINEKCSDSRLECVKIFDEKLYVCLPKAHFLSAKKGVTFQDLDGQSFLLANDLGVWDEIVKRRLPKSRFFKLEQDSLSEVAKYSSVPSFETNVSRKFDDRGEKTTIPILDEEAVLPFYAIYRPKKKALFDSIRMTK